MTVTIDAGETSTADLSAYLPLLARLRNGPRPQPDWSALVDDAVQVWARPGFDTFLALPRLRFEPFDYQLQAARTVLRRMRGRGILADEVGLGKTIEAGLVLSELRMRGLADQVLVIVPAGLVDQWRDPGRLGGCCVGRPAGGGFQRVDTHLTALTPKALSRTHFQCGGRRWLTDWLP